MNMQKTSKRKMKNIYLGNGENIKFLLFLQQTVVHI